MTTMITSPHPSLPDPNDERAIEAHKNEVLTTYAALFELIDRALQDSIPKAKNVFDLLGGPVELTVHAGLTRYLTRLFLTSRNISTEEEEQIAFDLERVSNCGLCVNHGLCQIRILKAAPQGIPKATSDARSRFYCSNQYSLRFDRDESNSTNPTPVTLVLLWSMGAEHSYGGLLIACPRRERADGTVDCYWITPWQRGEETLSIRETRPTAPESDLNEIRRRDDSKASS